MKLSSTVADRSCFSKRIFLTLTFCLLIVCFLLYYVIGETRARSGKKIPHPSHVENSENTLIWAVNLDLRSHDQSEIDKIAADLDLINLGQVGDLHKHYLFAHKLHGNPSEKKTVSSVHAIHSHYSKEEISRKISEIEKRLDHHDSVQWYSHQKLLSRGRKFLEYTISYMDFSDPYYKAQWHLTNDRELGMDVNVTDVWRQNITGYGITVAVVDDGLQWNNPDLMENYNAAGSWDLNDDDADPMPDPSNEKNHHGTRCAGEIAAVPNDVCGVGVAYGSHISGIRLLDGPLTDSLEAEAFTKFFQINHIYSCSWGPDDDGRTVDGPHVLAAAGMKHGIDFGRGGYGSIYVVASGNGGQAGDNCNYDGYANSLYTVTIGAVDETGQMPYYSEECASMLAVTFSSGAGTGERDIVTTDWTFHREFLEGCTKHHTGTSAAAPIAAGLIALMLEANPCLTWRDVQWLIALTAVKIDIDVAHWQRNGAGLWHSHKHGFGLMNAWRLVNAAKVWDQVPWQTSFSYSNKHISVPITKGHAHPLTVSYTVTDKDAQSFDLYLVETAQVTLTLSHPFRGHLEFKLTSPAGTVSVMGTFRPHDNSSAGFDGWTFSTVRCWGEVSTGTWTLTITDKDSSSRFGAGTLHSWSLKLFGTPMTPAQFTQRTRALNEALHGRYLNRTAHCAPPPVTARPDDIMSVKTLKIVLLMGSFCFLFAMYETFEYLCCYGEEKKEHSKLYKLVKRAHILARQHLYGTAGNQCNSDETTQLLSNNIPMETFQSSNDLANSGSSESNLNVVSAGHSLEECNNTMQEERNDLDNDDIEKGQIQVQGHLVHSVDRGLPNAKGNVCDTVTESDPYLIQENPDKSSLSVIQHDQRKFHSITRMADVSKHSVSSCSHMSENGTRLLMDTTDKKEISSRSKMKVTKSKTKDGYTLLPNLSDESETEF